MYWLLTWGVLLSLLTAGIYISSHGIEISNQSPYVTPALTRMTGWHWLSGSLGVSTQGAILRIWAKNISLARSATDPSSFHSGFATCTVAPLAWLRREPLISELRLQDLTLNIPKAAESDQVRKGRGQDADDKPGLHGILERFSWVVSLFHAPFPIEQMILNDVSIRVEDQREILRIQDWVLNLEQDKDHALLALKADGRIAWNNRLAVIDIQGIPDLQGAWQLRARIFGAGLPLLTPLFPELIAWEPYKIWGNLHINAHIDPRQGMDLKAHTILQHARGKIPVNVSGKFQDNGRWHLNAGLTDLRPVDFRNSLAPYFPLGELTTPLHIKADIQGGTDLPTTAKWRLQAGSGTLTWKPLFRWPFSVTRLNAHGTIQKTKPSGFWNLVVTRFDLLNTQGRATGGLTLHDLDGPDPILDLHAEASGVPVEQANHFYPVAIMSRELVDWLDRSLKNGRVNRATARILGPVAQIPFPDDKLTRKNGWIFRIEGDVSGTDLLFHKGLPPVTRLTTHLIFDRLSMLAMVTDGTIGQSRQIRGQVGIPNMLLNPVVIIDATTQADLQSIWKEFIAHPSLRWDQALGLTELRVVGHGPAHLKVSLPLEHLERSTFQGNVELTDAFLKLPFLDTPIEQLSGKLTLNTSELKLSADSGVFNKMPFQGTLNVKDYHDPVKTHLLLDVDALALSGQVQEALQPLLDPAKSNSLPETPFHLELSKLPQDARFHFDLRVDADTWPVAGKLGWVKSDKDPGNLIGTGFLDPDQKNIVFQRLSSRLGNLNFEGAGTLGLDTYSGQLVLDRLQLGETLGFFKLVRKARATGEDPEWKTEMVWDVLDVRPLLKLFELPDSSPDSVPKGDKATPARKAWPHWHVHGFARRIILAQDESARDMEIGLRMQPEGYKFDRLLYNQDGFVHRLESGEFRWLKKPGFGPYSGRFRLISDNLGNLLKGLDRHQGMQGGKATLNLDLAGNLPAASHSLLQHLTGKGEIESHKGIVRRLHLLASLLGLLSIPDLPNLLVGDRPDLAGTGFYYEKMHGNFTLENGLWHTDQWALVGPSMKIVASGDVNLVTRQLDLLVGIQPLQTIDRIINRVPILGKLVAGSREAILETQFQVSGPWSDPVTRIKPMDSLAPGIVRDIINLPGKLLKMSRPFDTPSQDAEKGAEPKSATEKSPEIDQSQIAGSPTVDQTSTGKELIIDKNQSVINNPADLNKLTDRESPVSNQSVNRDQPDGEISATRDNPASKQSATREQAIGKQSATRDNPASRKSATRERADDTQSATRNEPDVEKPVEIKDDKKSVSHKKPVTSKKNSGKKNKSPSQTNKSVSQKKPAVEKPLNVD
ncbi:MAG: AsmA-like C-terminal domain-containing protein [Magnetococcales bacterium]|nr:AsmA-like C-terminal domain-containing protein [Magnetococcales bacterium]